MESALVETPSAKGQSKSKTPKATEGDLQAIQADVASFAAQLGLATGGEFASGFYDADFRKTGPVAAKKDKKKTVSDNKSDPEKGSQGKKDGQSPSGGAKKGENTKNVGKLQVVEGKARQRNRGSKDESLSFGVDTVAKEKGKGRKRSLPSDTSGQDDGKSAKKERQGDKKANGGDDVPTAGKKDVSLDRASSKVSLQSGTLWYESAAAAAASLQAKSSQERDGTVASSNKVLEGDALVASKRSEAEQLMDKTVADYEKSRSKNSDARWLMTARRSGTSADKVAAMTVMLQDNPMLNLRTLDALVGMVTSKGGKRHAAVGIDALKELFLISLLPDRKLKFLNQQPLTSLGDSKESASVLLYWYWEDCLKRRYERFIVALEEATKDTLPFLKEKALKTVYVLLKSKPEQERRLLSALVNKLGDPERKVASNASYLLSCLLTAHPNMKTIVVEEVDAFVFRPHVGTRARYYAAVFLNQIMLTNRGDGPLVAKQLINLYFALFRTVTVGESKHDSAQKDKKKARHDKRIKKAGGTLDKQGFQTGEVAEVDTRLLSALLTGVNRAFPYVAADDVNSVIEEHTPVLFRLVHSNNFNVAVQALMLLHQLLLKNQAVSERFYRALYSVLLSPSLTKSSKAEMFLNLVFKALKEDIDLKRMAAFAKRLTQVALQQPPQFACGCLLLLSEVLKARPSLWDGILKPEDQDEEIEHFVDILDEDAVNKAHNVKPEDASGPSPVKENGGNAEVKEESDSDAEDEEKEKLDRFIPDLRDEDDDISSDEEDGPDRRAQEASKPVRSEIKSKAIVTNRGGSGATVGNTSEDAPQKTWPAKGYYDPRHRDPSYCSGEKACWWELSALARHMHPSVASMARTLLSGANVVYSGDPLRDLVLGAFLDRFSEKKPKARKHKEDGTFHASAMAVPNKTGTSARLVGEELLALDESEVAPEDVVFHKFYQTKASKSKIKKTKERKGDEDDDITGLDDEDGDLMHEDDSEDDEVDALLEKDEHLAMGSAGVDGEDDVEEGESDGEFDYDKLSDVLELEDDLEEEEEEKEEELTETKKARKRKGKIAESMGSDSDDWDGSEEEFALGEPPESESEDDSLGSIELGDLPSDDEDSKVVSKKLKKDSKSGTANRTPSGEVSLKKKKTKRRQVVAEVVAGSKKGKSKSPFASFQEYADLLEETDEGTATKDKGQKAKGKKSRSS